MKIAMFGHKRIPSREGGVEVVVEELCSRMAEMGHRIVCYNRRGHHVSGEQYDSQIQKEYRSIRLRYVWTLDKKGLAAVTSSFFAALCSACSKADVVHIHAEGPAFMCWLPKLFGKRVVVTVHGLDWKREKWQNGFAAVYIHAGEKIAARFADEIIVLSKNVQNYFKQVYGRDTLWIPNGVSRQEPVRAELIFREFGLQKDNYILFLGRLVPEKGVDYLIRAFQNVKTDKKLVIAGGSSDTGAYEEKLKELASGNSNILFTGFVQGQLLEELYSNAYIYVLPSDVEGMPLSLLEAMSYGNCCVVSDIPECTEVVEDKAVIFERGDIEDLIQKIQFLCNDARIVEAYKSQSPEFVCSKYDWKHVVEQTLNVYRGVHNDSDSPLC